MKELRGKVVVITGAGSGIGRALAVALANEGSVLALSDVKQPGLDETKSLLPAGTAASTHILDVSDRSAVHDHAAEVNGLYGQVDVVVNNAGVHVDASLADVSYEDLEWIMNINFWGMVYGSKEFLPFLLQRPEARLLNMASVHALFTSPRSGPYCASKFAIRGFTMSLAQDLRGTPVKVSLIVPGGVKTDIVRSGRYGPGMEDMQRLEREQNFDTQIAKITPERAAQSIVKGIRSGTPTILVGRQAHSFHIWSRLFPSAWQKAMSGARMRPEPSPDDVAAATTTE